ncbi:MAG: fasciclin domain-containing protein [Bacteroidaceae bacterium]|nr:fasciclin domain-containing protein [Bacteroidaceae bacterium]
MKILNFKSLAVALIAMTAVQFSLVSCSDDPGVENYYTSTSEYATDYLQGNDQYSMYVQILQRATGAKGNLRLVELLASYGSYTVFAPTNDAVKMFLASKGVSSVDELPKEDCDTVALNSIIETAYFTTDVSDGTYPQSNMLDQYLTIRSDSDLVSNPGQVTLAMYVNDARLIQTDDSVSNGVVHTVDRVVLTSTQMISEFIDEDENCSLYAQALKATGVDKLMLEYEDETYSVGSDSIDWTNDALVLPTASESDNVAYMEHRYYKYTFFICPDSVLEEKYGITTLDDLRAKAHELYDPVYPEDANITDETDRRNALNRFISYHILDRYGSYYTLTAVDGQNSTLAINWNRRKWDIADWYETMMPHSILKCSFPSGTQAGLYINRRGVQSRADERGVFVRGAKVTPTSDMNKVNTCLNGIYHYIDDIIAYDENTQNVVLNERLRIDASTLSPDFMTSEARGHYTRSNYENGKYGIWDNTTNHNNKQTCLGFKAGYAKNFEYTNNTHLHVRPRTLSFWSYQGDEVTILGIFDFKVKIPPVPAGTYELRLFTCVDFSNRGIIQVYIDDIPQGIPFDMRPGGTVLFGWQSDTSLGDEDAIASFDKSIHNLGWMKGPKSYYSASTESGGTQGTCFRDAPNTIRKVLGHFTTDGKTDHYLRFQQKLESTKNAMNFDFLEVCPSSVYNNEYYAEDRW